MPRGVNIIILLGLLGILVPACRDSTPRRGDALAVASETPADSSLSASDAVQWADSVMSAMTLEQLAGQLIFPAVFSDDSELAMRSLMAYVGDSHIGGVVLLKGSPKAAKTIADTLLAVSCAPPFIAIDAEWGLAMRLSDTPVFPRNGKISPSAEDTLLYQYGLEVARECRHFGINMVLGPVLDVLPEGDKKTFIGTRSFGSDPEKVTRRGVSYAKGLEDGGVLSVAKHFPGHGSAGGDSHKRLPLVSKSLQELKDCDLMPFEHYIKNGLSGVMIGHLYVPALDSVYTPVSVSPKILKEVLRQELGFEGLIITDAMNMAGADGKSGADAIMAGADIVLAPSDTRGEVSAIVDAVRSGCFPLEQLRQRVRRVLVYKYMVGEKMPDQDFNDNSARIRTDLLQ